MVRFQVEPETLRFGPRERAAWRQFAKRVQGELIEVSTWRRWIGLGRDRVIVDKSGWRTTLDTVVPSNSTFTRMRAPFMNKQGFRFEVSKSMREAGRLRSKGSDETKVRTLLANPRISELIGMQPSINIKVKSARRLFRGSLPRGTDELLFEEADIITDSERLLSLVELFVTTLEQLSAMGLASRVALPASLR